MLPTVLIDFGSSKTGFVIFEISGFGDLNWFCDDSLMDPMIINDIEEFSSSRGTFLLLQRTNGRIFEQGTEEVFL